MITLTKNIRNTILLLMFFVNTKAQLIADVAYHAPVNSLTSKDAIATTNINTNNHNKKVKSRQEYVLEVLDVFGTLSEHEIYQLTIAADVPDNNRPAKVFFKKEPGHVFIILEKKDTVAGTSVAKVWGFYPVKPVSCLFFRKTKSILTDNSSREYNAAITRRLSVPEFNLVKLKAAELAEKKYHINRFNCYDYAVEIFNSLPGAEHIPVTHIKFPLIFGRGGSPCGLYADLVKIKNSNGALARTIHIGNFKAPHSTVSSKTVQ